MTTGASHTSSVNLSDNVMGCQVPGDYLTDLFSDAVTQVFSLVVFGVICQVISIFGVATNIINIACFIKQGCHDPVNVNFIALAISDIGCLTTLMWTNICFTPAFMTADLPFDSAEFQYLTGGMPHATFTRITSWITAFITLERCLCITVPFKVKTMFTKQRGTAVVVCIFIILLSSAAPPYFVNSLGMKYFPQRNKTLLGLIHGTHGEKVESVSYIINNVVVHEIAFLIIMVCTVVIVVYLEKASHWKKKSMVTPQAEKIFRRNQKIARMVIMISTLFICCFFPFCAMFLAMSLEPEFSVFGKYRNMLSIFGGVGAVMESINSSANICIYYFMSIKFRIAFKEVCMCEC